MHRILMYLKTLSLYQLTINKLDLPISCDVYIARENVWYMQRDRFH